MFTRIYNGILSIISLLIISTNTTYAISEHSEHIQAISIDIGGPGGVGCVNYERRLFQIVSVQGYGSIGLSSYKLIDYTNIFNPDIIIPIGLTLTSIPQQHQPIIGIGTTISNQVHATLDGKQRKVKEQLWRKLGYRYNFKKKPMYIQAAYVAINQSHAHTKHWGGLTWGIYL